MVFILATFFNVFKNFFQRFFLFFEKKSIENPIKSFVKNVWDHRNELTGHSDVA